MEPVCGKGNWRQSKPIIHKHNSRALGLENFTINGKYVVYYRYSADVRQIETRSNCPIFSMTGDNGIYLDGDDVSHWAGHNEKFRAKFASSDKELSVTNEISSIIVASPFLIGMDVDSGLYQTYRVSRFAPDIKIGQPFTKTTWQGYCGFDVRVYDCADKAVVAMRRFDQKPQTQTGDWPVVQMYKWLDAATMKGHAKIQ